jgi:hypothetical protein
MHTHVAIRRRSFVAAREIDIFTQTAKRPLRPIPTGRIAAGERVWMKLTPGREIVATALIRSFRELHESTLNELRDATAGFALYDLEAYWDDLRRMKGEPLNALVIYLADGRRLASPFTPTSWPSHNRCSWVIDPPGAQEWPIR